MYYNLTTEERYILTLSDTMLKEGYTVDEVIEFLQCEDMDQVECILGTLTLTESADVDHQDLELVVERIQALGRIGSWLTRQAGKLKGAFGRGAASSVDDTVKITGSNPNKGFFSGLRNRLFGKPKTRVTGDVVKKSSKLKTAAKVALPVAGAALLVKGIDDVMKDKPGLKDDPNRTNTTTGGGDKEDGLSKGYGSRTRKYGWWQKSHASSPYVDSVSNYNNIRRNSNK